MIILTAGSLASFITFGTGLLYTVDFICQKIVVKQIVVLSLSAL